VKKIVALLMVIMVKIAVMSGIVLLTACDSDEVDFSHLPSPQEIFDDEISRFYGDTILMVPIDESRFEEFQIDVDDTITVIAKEAAISAIFVQLFIIEAQPDRINAVYSAMLRHQANLQDATAYPQGAVAAAASVVGVHGNLVYLFCDERADEIEGAFNDFLDEYANQDR